MHKIFLLIACGLLVVDHRPVLAGNIIVGVNTPGVQYMNDQQQDALIEQLQKNGVTMVRIGIGDRFSRFIIEAHKHGIGAVVVVWPITKAGAQPRRSSKRSITT